MQKQKTLACKKADGTKSYINRYSVHWRIGGRWSYGTTLCRNTYSANRHKGWEHCWGGSIAIHRGANGSTTNHKGAGDAKAQWRAMEMERSETEVVVKKDVQSWIELHFWRKVLK